MESLLVWGLALVAASIVLIFIEFFVPSAGLISVVAACCGIGGVICLFIHDWRWGVGGMLALAVLVPMAIVFGLQVLPATPLGKRLMYGEDGAPRTVLDPNDVGPYVGLLGREGEVLSDLRPVGVVRIDDERLDALSEIGLVRAGTRIKVTSVEGRQVKVRPVA
ncbi:MAG: hypothetical protein KF768_07285 [Phycisphaeraceae bacterium]|nr:hypothetical protein [Phycisphaeraceae bacterium]